MSDLALMTIKGKKRYLHIIDIAYSMFIENGYDFVNAKDIIRKSGGSLSSLYKYFGSKEELFVCTLKIKNEEIFANWHNLKIYNEMNLETYLYFIGKKFLDLMIDHNVILFYHLILSVKFTINFKIYQQTIEDIINYPVKIIANHLEQESIKKCTNIKDSLVYAQQFLYFLQAPCIYKNTEIANVKAIEEFKQNILDQTILCFV